MTASSPTRIVALALAGALVAASLAEAAPAAAAPPSPNTFCAGTADINAALITSAVNLSSCAIQSRRIVLMRSDGRSGPAVDVPAPGRTIGNETLTTSGEYSLSVTNNDGLVSVATEVPGAGRTLAPATDAACGEGAYNLEGGRWTRTLNWYYNSSSVSRAGLSVSATLADIRAGNTNMSTGQNNCGYATGTFGSTGAYQGTTSRYANINSSAQCTGNFPDGQNTDSWGPFDSSAAGTLAVTCYTYSGGAMTEVDTYFGSNVGMVDSFPASCSGKYDLQSVSTHEWGHAFGLAHETSGTAEVMYPYSYACALRRHLGKGDYNGMNAMY